MSEKCEVAEWKRSLNALALELPASVHQGHSAIILAAMAVKDTELAALKVDLANYEAAFTELDDHACEAFCDGVRSGEPTRETIDGLLNATGKVKGMAHGRWPTLGHVAQAREAAALRRQLAQRDEQLAQEREKSNRRRGRAIIYEAALLRITEVQDVFIAGVIARSALQEGAAPTAAAAPQRDEAEGAKP